jgi:hypothetical protein
MAKGGRSEAAKNKANKGQDEKTHVFVNQETGESREATQREFRNELKDQGFVPEEDVNAGGEDESGDDPVQEQQGEDAANPETGADSVPVGDSGALEGASDGASADAAVESAVDAEVDPNNYASATTEEELGFVNNPVAGGAIPSSARGDVKNGVDTAVDNPGQVPTAAGPRTGENVVEAEGDDATA